jgi:hypothetical protein
MDVSVTTEQRASPSSFGNALQCHPSASTVESSCCCFVPSRSYYRSASTFITTHYCRCYDIIYACLPDTRAFRASEISVVPLCTNTYGRA